MKSERTEGSSTRQYPLKQIYFYLTRGCNLKCRHCWIDPQYQMPGEDITCIGIILFTSIIEQAIPLGLTGVKLTGGEPLLHPGFHEILEIIRFHKLQLSIETNGVLCTPETAKNIRSSSSRLFVSVSLDGSIAEVHDWIRGVEGSFESALQGISNLINAGIKPQIIMSLMRVNKDQVEPMIRLAETLGVGSVKFNPVQPTARGEKMHEALETLSVEELIDTGKWIQNVLSETTDVRIVYTQPLAFQPLGKMFSKEGSSCGICGILSILGVLADGSYSLCGIGETVPDLIFGHAEADSLAEVWSNAKVLNELRNGLPKKLEGVCSECLMKVMCKGSCIAQNYYRGSSLFKPYWFCEEARGNGLFPELRMK